MRSTGAPVPVVGIDRATRRPSDERAPAVPSAAVPPPGGRRQSCDSPSTCGRGPLHGRTEKIGHTDILTEHLQSEMLTLWQYSETYSKTSHPDCLCMLVVCWCDTSVKRSITLT